MGLKIFQPYLFYLCDTMQDPIEKYQNLQNITENIFNGLWSKLTSPPSATLPSSVHAANARQYQQTYGVHYIIKGFSKNKYYDASDLIKLYKNGQIKNDTEIKRLKSKKGYFPFINLLKREPFASQLKDFFVQSNDKPNPNVSYSVAVPVTPARGDSYYKTVKITVPKIAKFIIDNPGIDDLMNIYDSESEIYIPIKSSGIWPEIEKWTVHYRGV